MKLADIKQAVENAALSELKRSIYNACAVCSENVVRSLFEKELTAIFSDDDEAGGKASIEE